MIDPRPHPATAASHAAPTSLYPALAEALAATDVDTKLRLTENLAQAWRAGRLVRDSAPVHLQVGRPERPALVSPAAVPRRSPHTAEGRAALLHAIVHIEFSAINLALDHAVRFRDQPDDYIADWIEVAAEEVYHFRLLRERLQALGYDYGDFPAHEGLWQMAEKTAGDVLARMAMVPRLLEARGLDATPPIQAKLEQVGDEASARLLDIILRDEIGHVGLGDKWFRRLCAERQLPPEATYRQLLAHYHGPRPQAPMNRQARLAAGFTEEELADLAAL